MPIILGKLSQSHSSSIAIVMPGIKLATSFSSFAWLASSLFLISGCGYQLVRTEEPAMQQQDTMQKKVNILENVALPDGRPLKGYIADVLRGACARKAISQSEFDSLLMSGATVASSMKWDESIIASNVVGRQYSGRCLGQAYILEGSRDILYLL